MKTLASILPAEYLPMDRNFPPVDEGMHLGASAPVSTPASIPVSTGMPSASLSEFRTKFAAQRERRQPVSNAAADEVSAAPSSLRCLDAWSAWVDSALHPKDDTLESGAEQPKPLYAQKQEQDRRQKAVDEMMRCLQALPQPRALRLNYRSLTSLPTQLPPRLKHLELYGNGLSALPECLPHTLENLTLHKNAFTRLPASLPDSIQTLGLNRNRLTRLPSVLPSSLRHLCVLKNRLNELKNLPLALESLSASDNHLTKIDALPQSMHTLMASRNMLSSLPALPKSLKKLYASDNRLTELPALPQFLDQLTVFNNFFQSLPALPIRLRSLDVSANCLTSLPELPDSLRHLNASYNALVDLPVLPASLLFLNVGHNPLARLPAVSRYLIDLRADEGAFHATLIYWENQVVAYEQQLSRPNKPAVRSPKKLRVNPSVLETMPGDVLKEIAKHFAPGSTDALSLACTSKAMHGAMAERLAMDKKIALERLMIEAATQLERVGCFQVA
ncbi:MAG: hypothetical protein V4695_10995 [Pseudomonadota bacterium]